MSYLAGQGAASYFAPMDMIAILLASVLAAAGLVHLIWAFGIHWPIKDETALARAVVGARGIEKMPPRLASLFVATCLFGAALWALMLRGFVPDIVSKYIVMLGGLALFAVFIGRGVFGVLPAFERAMPEQPFLKLNRMIYSPLCVLIAIGFALLVIAMPNWSWRLG